MTSFPHHWTALVHRNHGSFLSWVYRIVTMGLWLTGRLDPATRPELTQVQCLVFQ